MPHPVAAKLPLKPGEFRFVTNGLQIEMQPAGEDGRGRRRFKAVASSTAKDLRGDEMQMSALQDMVASFRRGLNIFMDHNHMAENVFGRSDTAEIVNSGQTDPRNGATIWDLHIGGTVNEPNPKAVQLADSIDGGYVSFGTSIGAFVTKADKLKDGGRSIQHVDCKEASIVGIPMNQRAWTYKSADANWTARAADAAATLEQNALFDGEDGPQTVETFAMDTDAVVTAPEAPEPSAAATEAVTLSADGVADVRGDVVLDTKGEMSAATRNDLPDSEFACPEKRKYPINDKAHIRAALSRIADPSNDQCGRDKILAAARREGIGDADEKGLSDDDLLVWAATDPEMLRNAASICPDCGGTAAEPVGGCQNPMHTGDADHDGDDPAHGDDPDMDGKAAGLAGMDTKSDTTADGQEAPEATPETAPTAADGTDPAPEQKALSFDTADVVELVGHVRTLTGLLDAKSAEITLLTSALDEKAAEIDRLTKENEEAARLIEKVMALPLRRKAVHEVQTFSAALPDFLAPEVKRLLSDNR